MRLRATCASVTSFGAQKLSLLNAALKAIRRNNGSAWWVPDDFGLVLGPELVTNGDFSNGTAGWATTNGTLTASSGAARVTSTATAQDCRLYSTALSLTASKQYIAKVSIIASTSPNLAKVSVGTGGGFSTVAASAGAVGASQQSVIFTATAATMYVWTNVAQDTGAYFDSDNISVREVLSAGIYTDSTGVTPVSAVGDVIGLLTDRSYGSGNLSAISLPALSTWTYSGWAYNAGGYIDATSGVGNVVVPGIVLTPGKSYKITCTAVAPGLFNAVLGGSYQGFYVVAGTNSAVFVCGAGTSLVFQGGANNVNARGFTLSEVLGNHATQATTANKPVITRVPRKLGPELVTNGDFSSGATGWSFPGGSIASGVATWSGASADLQQPIAVTAGKSYKISFSVTSYIAGTGVGIHNGVGPFIRGALTRYTAVGTYSETLTATQAGSLTINGAFVAAQGASIDNISVREVLEWSNAMQFDGSNDSLQLSSVPFQMNDDHFAVCAFSYTTARNQTFFAPSGNTSTERYASIGTTPLGNLIVEWYDGTTHVNHQSPLQVGTFYVVSAVRAGGRCRTYLNGALVGDSAAFSTSAQASQAHIGIGGLGSSLGSVGAVVCGKNTLTDADRKAIERFAAYMSGATYAG